MGRGAAGFVVALILAVLAVAAQGAWAQGGVQPPPTITVKPTAVYGVGAGNLEGYVVEAGVVDYARGALYLTGSKGGAGFLAAVTPAGVLWSQTLEGVGVVVASDNPAAAGLVAAVSDLGDLVIVNASDPGYYAYYYRAIRGGPEGLYVLDSGKVVALGSDGSLYVFKPPLDYWFEMGLETGQAAATYQDGVSVGIAAPVEQVNDYNNYTYADAVVVVPDAVSPTLYANLYGYVYYLNDSDARRALTGTWASGNTTERRVLRVWLLDIYYRAPETLSGREYPLVIQDNTTGNYTLTGVYPASYYLYVEYEVGRYSSNGTLVGYECYAGMERVDLAPGLVLEYNITVEKVADTPEECKAYRDANTGISLEPPAQMPAVVLRTSRLPEAYNPVSDLRFTYYPVDGASGLPDFLAVMEPATRPLQWSAAGARYVAVLGFNGRAVLLLLDSNMEVAPAATGYYETVYLGSGVSVTAAILTPDGRRLYLGLSDGRVLELTWGASGSAKYVLTGSLQVSPSGGDVKSLSFASPTLVMASTSDGYAQVVDVQAWIPLWRGPAVFQGIDLAGASGYPGAPLGGLWYVQGLGILGYLEGTDAVIVPYGSSGLNALYPVYVTVNATLARLDGGVDQLRVDAGATSVEAYSDGELVAVGYKVGEGQGVTSLLFLPQGEFTLQVNASIQGEPWVVKEQVEVSEDVNYAPVNIALREVNVTVYTPSEGNPVYALVAGPKPGASVQLDMINYSTPYTPVAPLNATATTGPDGTAVLVVYDGAYYSVSASLEEYSIEQATVPPTGPQNVTLTALPRLYPVTVTVYDSEVARLAGQTYLVQGANVTLTLTSTGASVSFQLAQGTGTLQLPKGQYIVAVKARYYAENRTTLTVEGPASLTVGLEPLKYDVGIAVSVSDDTGILAGPVPGAVVTLTIQGLPLPPIQAVTGPDGAVRLQLRAGTYTVTVTHQVMQNLQASLTVRGPTTASFVVKPRYSVVKLSVLDSELADYGILVENAVVTFTYDGPIQGGSKTVNVPTGQTEILLPYGYYHVSAVAPGYQELQGQPLAVTSQRATINLVMTPIRYQVKIVVYFNDELWSLAVGPVPGALVTVKLTIPNYPVPPSALVTANDGSAVFNLRPGVYTVTVSHPLLQNYTTTIVVAGPVTYTLLAKPYYVDTTIIVLDGETQKPVPNSTLSLVYLSGGRERRVTLSLEDGALHAPLPAGIYQVEAGEAHYYTTTTRLVLEGVSSARLAISLQPMYQQVSALVSSKEVTVRSPFTYTIPSRPLPNATITLVPVDPLLKAVGVGPTTVTTGPDGRVTVPVRVGSYRVIVEADHFNKVETALNVAPGASIRAAYQLVPVLYNVSLVPVDPELRPGHDVVAGATIVVASWDGQRLGITYTYGVDATWILLPAGTYHVTVEAPYYQPAEADVAVAGPVRVEVPLAAVRYTVEVSLTLSSDFGTAPAAGVNVSILALEPLKNPWINATLGPDGRMILQLRRGTYILYARPPGYANLTPMANFTVRSDTSVPITVEAPVFTVSIDVRDSVYDFYGVKATVSLSYLGPYGQGTTQLQTSPNGRLTAQLPAGVYSMIVAAPGYEQYTTTLNITSNTTLKVKLKPVYVGFTVKVVDVDGKPVPGAVVTLRHAELPYIVKVTAIYVQSEKAAIARVPGGVRLGNYTLIVTPPPDVNYLKPYTTNVSVSGDTTLQITLMPKLFNVTIVLVDKETGKPLPAKQFTYIAQLKRTGAGSEVLTIPSEINITGPTTVTLPYGSYVMTLKAVTRDYYVLPPQITFTVDSNKTIQIPLRPKLFTVTVTVTDDRNTPLQGAVVRIIDTATGAEKAAGRTDSQGRFTASLRYGLYEVHVDMKGYKPAVRVMDVPKVNALTVQLQPGPVVLLKRFTPLIIGVAGLAAAGYIILRIRERIAARLMEEEEYF